MSNKSNQDKRTEISTFVFFDIEVDGNPVEGKKSHITELSFIAVTRDDFLNKNYDELLNVGNVLTLCIKPKDEGKSWSGKSGLNKEILGNEATFDEQLIQCINAFLDCLTPPICLLAHNGLGHDFPILQNHLKDFTSVMPFKSDLMVADVMYALHDMDEEILYGDENFTSIFCNDRRQYSIKDAVIDKVNTYIHFKVVEVKGESNMIEISFAAVKKDGLKEKLLSNIFDDANILTLCVNYRDVEDGLSFNKDVIDCINEFIKQQTQPICPLPQNANIHGYPKVENNLFEVSYINGVHMITVMCADILYSHCGDDVKNQILDVPLGERYYFKTHKQYHDKLRYGQPEVYVRLFPYKNDIEFHAAENDCMAMIRNSLVYKRRFVDWVFQNQIPFKDVPPKLNSGKN